MGWQNNKKRDCIMGQGKRPDQIKYSTMAAGWSIIGIIALMIGMILFG